MTHGVPAKVIASIMGLGAFTVAIIAGLAVDNPADQILTRALLSMLACHVVGFVVGLLAERTVADSISVYVKAHPGDEQLPDAGARPAAPEAPRAAA